MFSHGWINVYIKSFDKIRSVVYLGDAPFTFRARVRRGESCSILFDCGVLIPHTEVIRVSFMLQFFSPQMVLPHLGTKFIVTSACFLSTGQFKSSVSSTAAVE